MLPECGADTANRKGSYREAVHRDIVVLLTGVVVSTQHSHHLSTLVILGAEGFCINTSRGPVTGALST